MAKIKNPSTGVKLPKFTNSRQSKESQASGKFARKYKGKFRSNK